MSGLSRNGVVADIVFPGAAIIPGKVVMGRLASASSNNSY